MKNPLSTIQTLSKIGKILSKIIFIICIVAICFCIAGIVGVRLGGDGLIASLGSVNIYGITGDVSALTANVVYAAFAAAIISVIGSAYVAKCAERYFKNELKAGTPFTFEGADEMKRLGIIAIIVPIVAAIVSAIVFAVVSHGMESDSETSISAGASIGTGIMFLIFAVVFKYGASIAEEGRQAELQ